MVLTNTARGMVAAGFNRPCLRSRSFSSLPKISQQRTSRGSCACGISSAPLQTSKLWTANQPRAAVPAQCRAAIRRRISNQAGGDATDIGWDSQGERVGEADGHPRPGTDRQEFEVRGSLLDARRAGADSPSAGEFLEVSHAFGPEAVAAFAKHAGDNNPIHLDDSYARRGG